MNFVLEDDFKTKSFVNKFVKLRFVGNSTFLSRLNQLTDNPCFYILFFYSEMMFYNRIFFGHMIGFFNVTTKLS
jgi:hypothetical protein